MTRRPWTMGELARMRDARQQNPKISLKELGELLGRTETAVSQKLRKAGAKVRFANPAGETIRRVRVAIAKLSINGFPTDSMIAKHAKVSIKAAKSARQRAGITQPGTTNQERGRRAARAVRLRYDGDCGGQVSNIPMWEATRAEGWPELCSRRMADVLEAIRVLGACRAQDIAAHIGISLSNTRNHLVAAGRNEWVRWERRGRRCYFTLSPVVQYGRERKLGIIAED